ncbi:DUF427 domain-containing protein [Promicromonospora kroppenstedtii]|uniref:DUF427 domain-containing protein n=1 Tax=Promicromonospora kroppenstedtii TaxID=440482 RepID=UPI0004B9CF9B|nr:DUF427 domain-containing protein [Promicromonospora kroppenstedtii]
MSDIAERETTGALVLPEAAGHRAVTAPGTVEAGSVRVRAYSAGVLVADADPPLLVWEHSYYPQYFFAPDDVPAGLRPAGPGPRSRSLGVCELFDVVVGDTVLTGAARRYPEAPVEDLRDAVTLDWAALDTWLAEEEVIHTHARDPYVRVDAMPSGRHVRVVVGGEVVAESRRPVVLVQTGQPPRYYLPRVDVRMDLLRPTGTVSFCAYKGTAAYWSVVAGGKVLRDVAWGYDTPLREGLRIAGMVCFWPEKNADLEVYVDGDPAQPVRRR